MEDSSPYTPSKYIVPQLRQRSASRNIIPTDLPPRFNVLGFTNGTSRNLGPGTALTSILESPLSTSADPETTHLAENAALISSPAQGSVTMNPSPSMPAAPHHPVTAFKKFLPKNLREGDPDLYLIAFQEQLVFQIKEMTLASKRTNLPQHLVSPLAYLRALAHTVDQIKQPRQHTTTRVTRAKKGEQIQKLLDSLGNEGEGGLKDDLDRQNKTPDQDDGLHDLIASYDCDLRKQLWH
ncbi:hypothetical protein CLAIMM_15050 [Cladophialophora immunda]|nr:hypothetical protein CLAIMM_15050 [Cladophialophora immunda]